MSGPGRFTTAINEMGLTTPLSVAAAGFAGAGVPVFPCAPGGKHPITEHGFHEATTNLAQVRQWWRRFPKANIGVPTGRPSGVVVVDVDVHGVNGFAACCRAKEAGLLSGWEVVVRSPSGGLHAYYPAHESAEQRSWQAGRAGIDFRGDGGYIIAPPSRRAVNGELPHDEAGQGSNVTGYVEHRGFEPLTSSMPWKRATNCANAPSLSAPLARRPEKTSAPSKLEPNLAALRRVDDFARPEAVADAPA